MVIFGLCLHEAFDVFPPYFYFYFYFIILAERAKNRQTLISKKENESERDESTRDMTHSFPGLIFGQSVSCNSAVALTCWGCVWFVFVL